MTSAQSTPALSRTSSHSSKGRRSPALSLDFSDLPPLIEPSPPSNTLLITNLQDPATFAPPTLAHLRELISTHAPDPIYSFSPLRSLRRIIITFTTIEAATVIRQILDGEELFGYRIRVYFGESVRTDILSERERHLQAPQADKQFFISPPPSPPHGWELRDEEPPNKEVHAEDLAQALEKLSARHEEIEVAGTSPITPLSGRDRSSSLRIIYHPEEHGLSPALPAIAVEDLTISPGGWDEDEESPAKATILHTSRPPVELMS